MKKAQWWGAIFACWIPGLIAYSPDAFADESVNMSNGMTCWRNQAGVIISCAGEGRAGSGSKDAPGERRYQNQGNQGAIYPQGGRWIVNPNKKQWVIPPINKQWNIPSSTKPWTIPPVNKQWKIHE